jgi:hypothetical protein
MSHVTCSIIVRSMDRPTLPRALASIAAQVQKPQEIIVVAACGPAHRPLPVIGADINVKLVLPAVGKQRLPRAEAANAGLGAASGEWIGFLDDDDELLPHHLLRLLPIAQDKFLLQGPQGRLVYALAQGVDEAGRKTDVYGRSFSRVRIWESTIFTIMSALFHRSLVADGCVFDESLEIHEDWDFWLQCSQKTGFTYVEEVTSIWHGAVGDSGCGFGVNANDERYRRIQKQVHDKWAVARESTIAELTGLTREAAAAHARGETATAIRLCQTVLRQDPENVNAANLLGMISLHRGDIASAHQLMTVAINNGPPHFGLMYNMGLIEEARGNPVAARGWFEKGLATNPSHEGLRRKLGLA